MKKKDNLSASRLDENFEKVPSNNKNNSTFFSRRHFLQSVGFGFATLGLSQLGCTVNRQSESEQTIQGFDETDDVENPSEGWEPVSDRKILVGIVGYGASRFGAAFGFQDHPNVEVAAVSDLFPDRRKALAEATGCDTMYESLEKLVKDDSLEAVFVATDAPSHARHCIEVLEHGKHVASAVPAVYGSLEDADRLYEAVKRSGLKYMMFETSCFRANLYAMRQIYKAGGFGKIVYAEGEYFHSPRHDASGNRSMPDSYKGWRNGLPPQFYPTHSDAYYIGVTDGSFKKVSCLGMPSINPKENDYNNPFRTQISLYRTNEGGMARMAVSWETQGFGAETGRVRGQKGSYYGKYEGLEENFPDLRRPPIPPGVPPGGHGGSHGRLMNEFVLSILEDRKPLVDIANALNMTVGGIVAHESAMKDGEWMEIPQYEMWSV